MYIDLVERLILFLSILNVPALCHLQIVGEIKAARDALVEITSRLRSYLYREFFQTDTAPPSASVPGTLGNALGRETSSPSSISTARDGHTGSDPPTETYHNAQAMVTTQASKVAFFFDIINALFVVVLR